MYCPELSILSEIQDLTLRQFSWSNSVKGWSQCPLIVSMGLNLVSCRRLDLVVDIISLTWCLENLFNFGVLQVELSSQLTNARAALMD